MYAPTPVGGETQIFLSLDKSKKQSFTEVGTKRLAALVESKLLPDRARLISAFRTDGVVFYDSVPLAKSSVSADGSMAISWNQELLVQLGIDSSGISSELELLNSGSPGSNRANLQDRIARVQWSG